MPKKTRSEELTAQFFQTPEMQECKQMAGSVNNKLDPGDTVSIRIDVPKEFIRLTEFLEMKRAAEAGVTPRPAAKVLNQVMLNELHQNLHWLTVGPLSFSYYRNLWNRFCDEQGAPEEKLGDDGKPIASKGGEEGPF